MTTVFDVLTEPNGDPIVGAVVLVELIASLTDPDAPGYIPAEDRAVFSRSIIKTDATGRWEADLPPTAGSDNVYANSGLVYRIQESHAGAETTYYIDVPFNLADIHVADILTVAPSDVPQSGGTADIDIADDGITVVDTVNKIDFGPGLDVTAAGATAEITLDPALEALSGLAITPLVTQFLEADTSEDATSIIGAVNVADIGVTVPNLINGVIPSSQIPAVDITAPPVIVDSEAEMLALVVEPGQVAIRTDLGSAFILGQSPSSDIDNWFPFGFGGGGGVVSVNGQTGVVVLDAGDVNAIDELAAGAAGGVATLDGSGFVPDSQISTDIARQADLDAHVTDTTDAHDATAISVDASGFSLNLSITDTDVQTALDTIDQLLLGISGSAGGDLNGTYPSPLVNTTHSGTSHAQVQAAAEANAAAALQAHEDALTSAHSAAAIDALTVNFTGLLTGSDTDVQTALDTLSAVTGANIVIDPSSFSGNLSGAVTNSQLLAEAVDQLTSLTAPVLSVNAEIGDVILSAADVGAVDLTIVGQPDGIAELDGTGRLTLAQWPNGLVTSVNGHGGSSVVLEAADIDADDTAWSGNLDGLLSADLQTILDRVDGLTIGGGGGSGHTIKTNGTPLTARAGLNFASVFTVTDDSGNNETDVTLDTDLTTIAGLSRTRGDILIGGTSAWDRLPVGAAGTVLTNNGTDVAWDDDITLPTPTYGGSGNTIVGGKINASGVHVTQSPTISATVSGGGTAEFMGSPFTYDFNPTITATNVELAPHWFGPMGGYNFIGTTQYNANSGLDILSPIGFADLSLVTNQEGTSRNVTPGWSYVSAKAFIGRGASGTVNIVGNDTTLGYGGIGATSVYATMAGATLTADELTEYTTNSFVIGDVTLGRLIGYQVLHRQQMADAGYRGLISAILQGQPGFTNAPISLTGGATTSGSPNITVSGGLTAAMDGCIITGTNIPALSKLNYVSATSATLESAATGSAVNATGTSSGLTFRVGFSTNAPTITEEIGIYVNRPLTGATALAMDAEGSVRLWNDTHTHTVAPSPVIHISGDHTLSVGSGLNSFLGIQIDTDITLTQTANPFGAAGGVRHAPTVTNPTSFTGVLVGANAAFTNGSVWNIATNAADVTLQDVRGYNNQPFFQRASGANTVQVTNAYGYYHKPTFATGSHATNSYGMYVATPGGAGTIDLNVGILVESSTRGTANISAIFGDAIVVPSIVGGLTDNADITIAAGATSVKGEILLDNPKIELWVSNYTHTVTGNLSSLFADNVFTMNTTGGSGGTGNGWYGVNLNGTVQYTQEANALAGAIAFQDATIYKNTTGSGNINLHDIYSFAAVPTVNANAASPSYNYYGFVSNPQFTRTTSGTGTGGTLRNFAALASVATNTQFTTVNQFYADLTVNGGVVTTRAALLINDATGAGTLTNQYGIDIAAMTKGATKNVGIRNASTSVLSGGIYGSESSGGNVVIHSTTDATPGTINLDNPYIEIGVTDFTSTDAIYAPLFMDNAITMNNSNGGGATGNQYRGYSHIPTVNYQLAGNIIAGGEAFYDGATYQNATGANVDPGPIRSIWITPVINFNNTSTGFASYTGIRVSPSVSRTTTGGTLTTFIQFEAAAPTINTGTTVTTRTALSVADASGAGTLTNNIGIDIANQAKGGTLNIGFRNASTTVYTPAAQNVSGVSSSFAPTRSVITFTCPTGTTVLTSAPQVTDGQDGQIITLVNVDSADTVTFSDQGTVASSNLRLGATTRALGPRDSLRLMYSSTIGDWIEIGFNNVT